MSVKTIDEQVANLTKHLNTMNAQIKEKQVALKGLESQVRDAEQTNAQQMKELEAQVASRIQELQSRVQPLAEEVKQLEAQKQAYMAERQSRLDIDQQQFRSIKAQKLAEIRALDMQIAEKTNRLVGLDQAIHDCKQRVAAI